jgi:hypothetical protein
MLSREKDCAVVFIRVGTQDKLACLTNDQLALPTFILAKDFHHIIVSFADSRRTEIEKKCDENAFESGCCLWKSEEVDRINALLKCTAR